MRYLSVWDRIQLRNLALDHADFSAPTRQHELDHTDHTDHTDLTDHTDQEYIGPERSTGDHEVSNRSSARHVGAFVQKKKKDTWKRKGIECKQTKKHAPYV